jgi:hypothetical protein
MKKTAIPVFLFITGVIMMATNYRKIQGPAEVKQQAITDSVHRTMHVAGLHFH